MPDVYIRSLHRDLLSANVNDGAIAEDQNRDNPRGGETPKLCA